MKTIEIVLEHVVFVALHARNSAEVRSWTGGVDSSFVDVAGVCNRSRFLEDLRRACDSLAR